MRLRDFFGARHTDKEAAEYVGSFAELLTSAIRFEEEACQLRKNEISSGDTLRVIANNLQTARKTYEANVPERIKRILEEKEKRKAMVVIQNAERNANVYLENK